MKVLSFDVGIKNMAYCCLLIDASNIHITDWGIMDLLNTNSITHTCNATLKSKNNKDKICNKKAKYKKDDSFFCEKHAKSSKYILPSKNTKVPFLKKQKVDSLISICKSHLIYFAEKTKKDEILNKIVEFYQKNCLEELNNQKKLASEIDLIDVGRNMKQCLLNKSFSDITHAVIENQLSPIANRMKTIQGMLAQYFIMIDENIDIQFISSSNKLKQFEITQNKLKTKNDKNEIITPNYKENKKDSVYFCNKIIENNTQLQKWRDTLLVSKKDDLADCFLQGLWYFKLHNIISYAEDLKINIV